MGAAHIVQGWFTLDKDITAHEDGTVGVAPAAAEALGTGVKHYSTGALFADWIPVLARAEEDRLHVAYVPADAPVSP